MPETVLSQAVLASRVKSIEELKSGIEQMGLVLTTSSDEEDGYTYGSLRDDVVYITPTLIAWGEGRTYDAAVRNIWESYLRFVYVGESDKW